MASATTPFNSVGIEDASNPEGNLTSKDEDESFGTESRFARIRRFISFITQSWRIRRPGGSPSPIFYNPAKVIITPVFFNFLGPHDSFDLSRFTYFLDNDDCINVLKVFS
jgi:hypothetical protein